MSCLADITTACPAWLTRTIIIRKYISRIAPARIRRLKRRGRGRHNGEILSQEFSYQGGRAHPSASTTLQDTRQPAQTGMRVELTPRTSCEPTAPWQRRGLAKYGDPLQIDERKSKTQTRARAAAQRHCARSSLITGYRIYLRGLAVLPYPCHSQVYDWSLPLLSPVPRDAPRRCALRPTVACANRRLCSRAVGCPDSSPLPPSAGPASAPSRENRPALQGYLA